MRRYTQQVRARTRAIDPRPLLVLLIFASLVIALMSAPDLALGVTLPLNSADMATMSARIVVADVVGVRSRPDVVDGIATDVVLQPVRTIKGTSAGSLTLSVPGGTLDGLTLFVSEAAAFSPGERVVVFLDRSGDVVAGRRGTMHVSGERVIETAESVAAFETRLRTRIGVPSPAEALGLDTAGSDATGLDANGPATTSDVSLASETAITVISPAAAPAGTGAVVKIVGAGFGAQGANSAVEFYYRSTTPIVASGSLIKSWSDTLIEVEVPTAIVNNYPASAGSGPVTVVCADGTRSAPFDFEVTFGYGGQKWPSPAQSFRVLENTGDYVGEGTLLQNAAETWNAASEVFSLSYAGSSATPSSGNDVNEVWWYNSGNTGILAEARYWYWGTSLIEADVTFNDYYTWGTGSSAEVFDIQSVAVHEFGHWLALRDLYGPGDTAKVMYGSLGSGTQRRSLDPDDATGIRWIYDDADVTPPETAVSGVPSTWTTRTVTVALDSSDDTDADPTIYYRIDSNDIRIYSEPFDISTEGESVVRYWAMDDSGNTETAQTASVRIDRTAPATTLSGATKDYGSVTLAAVASDAGSGVAHTYFRIDGGSVRTGAKIVVSVEGAHTVEAWSVDALGHVESPGASTSIRVLPIPEIDVERVAGTNRYSTSVAVSSATFADGSVRTAVLATGRAFADALSASALAGAYRGPLLLTDTSKLPDSVAEELDRLGVDSVVIVGGTSAVDSNVERELAGLGYRVSRVQGRTRYETSAQVARSVRALSGTPSEVIVARGDDFADALAAAPYAYARTTPILLVQPGSLPDEARIVLAEFAVAGVNDALVAGGTGAVSEGVESAVQALGYSTARAQGRDRYATAAALVTYAVNHGWTKPTVVGVTTGENFPDALGGGAAIGAQGGAIVLTRADTLRSDARVILERYTNDLSDVCILGGTNAVSSVVLNDIKRIWNLP